MLEENYEYLNFDNHEMKATTWEKIREMKDAGFEIGNHSYCHSMLSSFNEKQLEEDFKKSEKYFKEILNIEPDIFSLPFGHSISYNKTVEEVLQKRGL